MSSLEFQDRSQTTAISWQSLLGTDTEAPVQNQDAGKFRDGGV